MDDKKYKVCRMRGPCASLSKIPVRGLLEKGIEPKAYGRGEKERGQAVSKIEALMTTVNLDVFYERLRQNDLWGYQRHDWGKWLGILTEEFGEVGQAINRIHFPADAKPSDADNLYEELIHLAAVASAMAEQILEERERDDLSIM